MPGSCRRRTPANCTQATALGAALGKKDLGQYMGKARKLTCSVQGAGGQSQTCPKSERQFAGATCREILRTELREQEFTTVQMELVQDQAPLRMSGLAHTQQLVVLAVAAVARLVRNNADFHGLPEL